MQPPDPPAPENRHPAALPGVASAAVSFGNGSMAVSGEAPDEGDHERRRRGPAIARSRPSSASPDDTPFWRRDARAVSTMIAVGLLLRRRDRVAGVAPRLVAEPLYLLSMAVGGWPIARAALVASAAGGWT